MSTNQAVLTTPTQKKLKSLVPGTSFVKGTFTIVSFQQMIKNFINYVQQCPIPQINTSYADGKVDQKVINDLKDVNKSLKTHYTKIQNDAQDEYEKVHEATAIIGQIWHYGRIGQVAVKAIYEAVEASPDPLNTETQTKVTRYLQFIDRSLEDLENKLPKNYFDGIHQKLNKDISNLNSDFDNMQNAIPAGDGAKLDLTNLTEAAAKKKLDDQISSLNSDISTLQQEIAWETVGQVGIGIVGGLIAITNFWNPIGWAAAAGTAVGEVELAKDKADKKTQVDVDQTKIFVSEAEESILKPYYATKHYTTQIKTMVAGLEDLSQGINDLRSYIDSCIQDVEGFIADLGDKEMLELDYQMADGDFKALIACTHTLMGPDAFSNDPLENPKWDTMANNGKWQQILNDPNSPFYIKLLSQMKAQNQS